MHRIISSFIVAVAALTLATTPAVSATTSFGLDLNFVEPAGWNVGDADSTYQQWDAKTGLSNNAPDSGPTVNPGGLNAPTHSAFSPAFYSGTTSNFYSFSGPYAAQADIFNHGGISGAGGYSASAGTHVIVQIATTLNEGAGVLDGTLEIVDHSGTALTGGANGEMLASSVINEIGGVDTPFGPTSHRQSIFEFFLEDYIGDFRVQWTQSIHSSLDVLRVDSMIADEAFAATSVPEPATLALLAAGGLGVVARLRRRRSR